MADAAGSACAQPPSTPPAPFPPIPGFSQLFSFFSSFFPPPFHLQTELQQLWSLFPLNHPVPRRSSGSQEGALGQKFANLWPVRKFPQTQAVRLGEQPQGVPIPCPLAACPRCRDQVPVHASCGGSSPGPPSLAAASRESCKFCGWCSEVQKDGGGGGSRNKTALKVSGD